MSQRRIPQTVGFLILVVSLVGIVLSAAALYTHIGSIVSQGAYQSFCNVGEQFNCDKVNTSAWSQLFGIPLGSYGFVFFGVIFFLAFAFLGLQSILVANAVLVFALFAAGFSIFLFFISKFVIGTFCLLCIGLYAVSFIILLSALFLNPAQPFLVKVLQGIKGIIAFPAAFFSFKGSSAVVSTIGLVFFACLIFAIDTLDAHFEKSFRRSVAGQVLTPQNNEEIDLFRQWQQTPPESFTLAEQQGAASDFSHGPSSAPVTIIEFSDLQCPACQHAAAVLEELVARHPGKIRLIYKHYPLDSSCNTAMPRSIHQYACLAATLAQCSGAQGRFWESIDLLFAWDYHSAPQHGEEVKRALLQEFTKIGLDSVEAERCLEQGLAARKVADDVELGNKLGITGTPTLWINGKRLPRFKEDTLEQVVNSILDSAKGN